MCSLPKILNWRRKYLPSKLGVEQQRIELSKTGSTQAPAEPSPSPPSSRRAKSLTPKLPPDCFGRANREASISQAPAEPNPSPKAPGGLANPAAWGFGLANSNRATASQAPGSLSSSRRIGKSGGMGLRPCQSEPSNSLEPRQQPLKLPADWQIRPRGARICQSEPSNSLRTEQQPLKLPRRIGKSGRVGLTGRLGTESALFTNAQSRQFSEYALGMGHGAKKRPFRHHLAAYSSLRISVDPLCRNHEILQAAAYPCQNDSPSNGKGNRVG